MIGRRRRGAARAERRAWEGPGARAAAADPAAPRGDRMLLVLTLGLVVFGLVWVYSASAMLALTHHETSVTFLVRQTERAMIGFGFLLLAARLDYHWYERHWLPIFVGGVGLLVLTVVFGHVAGGARRWLGPFQPVEVARIATYVAIARVLASQKPGEIESVPRGLVPPLLLTGLVAGLLLLQPNLGSTLALAGVVAILLLVAGVRIRHLAVLAAAGISLVVLVIRMNPYMHRRVLSFLDGGSDIQSAGWQLHQSLVALGSGGLLGRGFGASLQKFYYLPDPHTDFILAIIGEERGLLGALFLLALLGLLVARGVRVACRARDDFGFYLGLACAAGIAVYTVLNAAVVTGLAPTTGLPLPFISYGGSALTMNMFAIGVLLNISYQGARGATPRAARAAAPGAAVEGARVA